MRDTGWLLASLWLWIPGTAAGQTPNFSVTPFSTPIPTNGNTAQSVVTGDFNGDGKLDLAVLAGFPGRNQASQAVVLLGQGDGTFRPGVVYQTGTNSRTFAAADLNHDGTLDLIVANFTSQSVAVLLGNKDGTFQPAVFLPTGTNNAWFVAVGDYNKDGNPDLAIAFESTKTLGMDSVGIMLGNGDGTFQAMTTFPVGSNPRWIGAADFNGDGNLDLVTTNTHTANVSVLLGDGKGSFQAQIATTTGPRPAFGVIADFNGDGKLDLAITGSGQQGVTVLLGKGDGSFPVTQAYTQPEFTAWITAADFDGDGKLDLAASESISTSATVSIMVMRGVGDGTFLAPVQFSAGAKGTGASDLGVAAADFNGDGKPDLVVANGPSGASPSADISVLLNTTVASTSPAITAVVNGASFLAGVSASTWVTIQGSNLSQTQRSWANSDFVNNNLPTKLDGVSVKIDNLAAYVYYISPTQLNVLAPDDTKTGPVQVEVTNAKGTSSIFSANKVEVSPAFFLFNAKYPAAVHTSGVYVGPPGLIPGAAFAAAKPGETIQLFATGFGPTKTPAPAGQIMAAPVNLANQVTATIGGKAAKVQFAGLIGSGLNQINVTVPADLPDGDALLAVTVGGASTQSNLFITVHH
jgi:uncharacterized protein (TIGR03437 family)